MKLILWLSLVWVSGFLMGVLVPSAPPKRNPQPHPTRRAKP